MQTTKTHAVDDDALSRARVAGEAIAPTLGELDKVRRLPATAVEALVGAGVFKLCVPRSLGGGQASPHTLIGVIEELARVDGSVGWVTMIGATSGLMSVYLDEAVAREIYAPADAITCGVFAPMGRATRTERGYRISGRWPFASGCEHSRWRMGGTIAEGDVPLPSGAPDVRSALFRAEDTTVLDTWDTVGLRGTGSHDFSVEDVEIPRERTFSLLIDRPKHAGYELPFFGILAAGVAAVGVGIARASIDNAVALVQTKRPPGSKKTLAHRELVQLEIAKADARAAAAHSLLHDNLGAAITAVASHGPDDPKSIAARARLRLAACHAATEAAAVVASMYELGGGSAVYQVSPLARQFRDAHVVTHHLMVSSTAMTMAGRALLGLDVDGAVL